MTSLVRIAPGALVIGKPLPWDVYDVDGNVLLRQGYIIHSDAQVEQLYERGQFKPIAPRPRKLEQHTDERPCNPFAEYAELLATLETTLSAVASRAPSAKSRLLGSARMLERICKQAPDATLALVHLYSVNPNIYEQTLFYGILSHFIARQFNLEHKRTTSLVVSALTANLALIPVADQLNASNHVLTAEQRAVIRKHPERAVEALRAAGISNTRILQCIMQHHEKADGSGYPAGLTGSDILPEAEILALAERYVAMITKRAYRDRMDVAAARKLLHTLSNGQFRPSIPRALLEILGDYPPGVLVRLANDEIGVVKKRPEGHRGAVVSSIISPRGQRYTGTFERNTYEPEYAIIRFEDTEVMPSMDFSLIWGFRNL
ncbi:Cyclic di-GMP phosphodiesterase response regulator RpfG [Marinobacter litoralis]|uniref:Cyclic di-GMP phosphodiesterase response regulator RpfG n=1 Tax=Marinobacter litoralis TaxID=187981 RepID=A0A3M2RBT3_9GAMM|nr:HD domain-containing phosphohydrolase [Marinobacter litoralis]RMJ02752.1 Cyclic di-GMP phosphodiesterase response regulator RpfG [Marinobacter litoralis]